MVLRKMALIPADLAAQLSLQQHTQDAPALSQLSNLDQQMRTILDDKSLSTDLKFKQYYNTLHHYGALKENAEQTPIPVRIQDNAIKSQQAIQLPTNETDLLATVPLAQKRGARLLLKYVRENPEIEWNAAKELIYKGDRIPRSNIFDLISDASRSRKNAVPPIGWQEFADALTAQNVPGDAIGNKHRWEYISRKGDPDRDVSLDIPTPSTGRRAGRRRVLRLSSESSQDSIQPGNSRSKKKTERRLRGKKNQTGSGRRPKRLKWDKLY